MPCGTYCYHNQWLCRPGRLRKLTEVQKQPSPTRDYGSEGARENSIRRRVLSTNSNQNRGGTKDQIKQTEGFGPLFGKRVKPSIFNNCEGCGARDNGETKYYYRSNGGTGADMIYWRRVMVGTTSLFPESGSTAPSCSMRNCKGQENTAGNAVRGGMCVLGGKNWLNYRRFNPMGARG